jgi:hypothetical protein
MDKDDSIRDLGTQAASVAQTATEDAHAVNEEREAEAALLVAVIAAVKPALASMSRRIRRQHYTTSGQNGCNPVEREEHFDTPGVVLVDNYHRVKDETGNRGDLAGERLVLATDGTLAVVERSGSFSHWQGEANTYTATWQPVTPREAMDRYDFDECLTALHDKIEKAAAAKPDIAARRARARRLRALVELIHRPEGARREKEG